MINLPCSSTKLLQRENFVDRWKKRGTDSMLYSNNNAYQNACPLMLKLKAKIFYVLCCTAADWNLRVESMNPSFTSLTEHSSVILLF